MTDAALPLFEFEGQPLPSQKRLGALLQERFVRHRRGGRIWYLDLSVEG